MKIVITHLTRMQPGFICVAGVDLATGQHVRPMVRSVMRKALLARYGGPFDIGHVVDLGRTRYTGTRPETEDYFFHAEQARVVEAMPAADFWALLERLAKPKLGELFGPDLQPRGPRSYGVAVGLGFASLGCYRPPARPRLVWQRRDELRGGRLRLEFASGQHEFELSVTDIRLYGPDHVTPDAAVVDRVATRLAKSPDLILGVGLTRPFRRTETEPAVHWLQVNNLHFADDPLWRLG